MRIEFTETAWEDLTYWIENDIKVLQKINQVTPLRLVLNFGILKQSVQASGD